MEITNNDCSISRAQVPHSPIAKISVSGKTKQPPYLKSPSIKILTHPVDKNIAWNFLLSVIFASIAIITGLPLVALLTIVLTWALAVRKLGLSCCLTRYRCRSIPDEEGEREVYQSSCCTPTRMVSPPEAFWLHDSAFNLDVAHCLFFLEEGLCVSKLRDIFHARVINRTNEDGQTAFPRLLRKPIPLCCGYSWIEDANFCLEDHIYEDQTPVNTSHDLERHLAALMAIPLPSDRPLWEMRIIAGYGRCKESILILRVHHAVSDAISLVRLLSNCLSDNEKALRLKPRFGSNTFFLNLLRTIVVGPLTFLGWVFFTRRDYNFLNRRHKPGGRVIAWSKPIRFSKVNRIKQVMRCTLNDVFVSVASGAVRAFFKKNGIRNPPNVTLSLPVDLRFDFDETETPDLGARYACVNVRLPCNTEGAIPRLWEVRHRMEELKTSPDPVVMYGAIHYLIPLLPECLSHWLLSNVCEKATVLLANVPGPEEPLSLGGKKLKRIVCWMAVKPRVPLAFSVISYGGNIEIAISADSAVVPQPQELVRELMIELGRLSHLLAKRRIPGEHRRRSNFSAERREEEIIKPPLEELQQKLQAVQEEVHEVTMKLNTFQSIPEMETAEENAQLLDAARRRLEELKEEFSELMTEMRRRKSLAEGIVINFEDEDLDGELRRPRRRALSSTGRRSSLASGRPAFAPRALQHAFVVSTPNLEAAGSMACAAQNSSLLQVSQDRFGRRKSDFN